MCELVLSVVSLCYMIKELKGGVLLFLISVYKYIPCTHAVLLKMRCYVDSALCLSFFHALLGHISMKSSIASMITIFHFVCRNKQFAAVENPGFWNWTFTLKDIDGEVLAEIDRDWRGFGFEVNSL